MPAEVFLDPPGQNSIDFGGPPTGGPGIDLQAGLNPKQVEAITHGDGPVLVLAGAGSGKTRVITHRIAYLVHHCGVPPHAIIAVTFTNKAAAEMRERVEGLIGHNRFGAWIGTFHAMCLRLLRREAVHVGLEPSFVIYDSDDQLAVVKRILKESSTNRRSARNAN
jgi:DNA helicase-2/ATP-dependent DNA helicase PcrA